MTLSQAQAIGHKVARIDDANVIADLILATYMKGYAKGELDALNSTAIQLRKALT